MKFMLLVLMTVGLFSAEKASALSDPGYMSACYFDTMYIDNNQQPTTVPWYYCICPESAVPFGDGDWDMGGGEHTAEFQYCFNAPVTRY